MPERMYQGPLSRGRVLLPSRDIPFVRGVPVEFTAEEAAVLDEDWSAPKPKSAKAEKESDR